MTLHRIAWLYRDRGGVGRYVLSTAPLISAAGRWQQDPFKLGPESIRSIAVSQFEACHDRAWHLAKGGSMRVKYDTHTGVFSHA